MRNCYRFPFVASRSDEETCRYCLTSPLHSNPLSRSSLFLFSHSFVLLSSRLYFSFRHLSFLLPLFFSPFVPTRCLHFLFLLTESRVLVKALRYSALFESSSKPLVLLICFRARIIPLLPILLSPFLSYPFFSPSFPSILIIQI